MRLLIASCDADNGTNDYAVTLKPPGISSGGFWFVVVYKYIVTSPTNSFQTSFGRFYAHPSANMAASALDVLKAGLPGFIQGNPSDPYFPKPSVTNIIRMINKEFLPRYYARLVAEYAVKNLETIRYQVEKFGEDTAIGTLKSVPNLPNRNAAIGDEIHDAIDQYCKNPDSIPEFSTTTAANMYQQWLYFAALYPMRIVRSEFTVWSYAHGFAGTGDLMVETDKGLEIWDTKSGNNVYPEVALQTSALGHADVILDANGNEAEMPRITGYRVMHIRPRSIKLYALDRTEEAWDTFLAAKRIFDWKRFDAPIVMATPPVISQVPKDVK